MVNFTSTPLTPVRRAPAPDGAMPHFRSISVKVRPGTAAKVGQTAFELVEQIIIFIAIAAFFGVSGFSSEQKLGQSEIVNTLALSSVLAFTLPVAFYYRKPAAQLLVKSPLLVIFLVISFFSVIWSQYPGLTLKRDGSLGVPILLALVVACRHRTSDTIVTIGRFVLILSILSAIVAILFPSVGQMTNREIFSETGNTVSMGEGLSGAWRGITAHKNTLGYIVSVGFGIYFWRFCFEQKRRALHLLICLFLCAVAYKARSATSILAIVLYAVLLIVMLARRLPTRLRSLPESLMFFGAIASLAMLPIALKIVTTMMGKDLSLTGRVPLWGKAIEFIADAPFLGYGYGAFWVHGSPQVQAIYDMFQWEPPNAHNAYLELALEVGIPGAVVGTLILLSVIVRSYRLARSGGPSWTAFIAMFSIVFAFTNMADTLLLRMGDIYCFMLVLSQFALVRYAQEQKQEPRSFNSRKFGQVTIGPTEPRVLKPGTSWLTGT